MKLLSPACLWTALLLHAGVSAQVRSDRAIVLEGAAPEDRQVTGLHDGVQEGDALNARSLRNAPYRYAEVAGTAQWAPQLTPPVGTAAPGLCLLLSAIQGNSGPVTIDLGAAGSYPLVKGAGLPLQAGDVLPGETVSAVFDGSAFQLIAARKRALLPCPSGSVAVNDAYCIQVAEHDTAEFDVASITCGQENGRVCSWAEWWVACNRMAALGLQDMLGDWEWTNNAANADGYVRVVGQSTCTQATTNAIVGSRQRSYRCCYRR